MREAAFDAPLPLRTDGVTVDEERLQGVTVGSINGVPAGGNGSVLLSLAPAWYVLVCNMSGHYLAGMRVDLLVTPA